MDIKQASFLKRPELPERNYDLATVCPHPTRSIKPYPAWGFVTIVAVSALLMLAFFALQCAGCFDGSYQ